MATIAFYSTAHRGHLHPTFSLATLFRKAGHRVVYFVPGDAKAAVESLDVEVRCYKGDPCWTLRDAAMRVVGDVFGLEVDRLIEEELLFVQVLPALVDLLSSVSGDLEEWAPDLVIYDSACPWAKIACRRLGIPAVSSCSSTVMARAQQEEVCGFVATRPDTERCRDFLRRVYALEYDPVEVYCNYDDLTIVWSLPELQPHAKALPSARFFGAGLPRREHVGDGSIIRWMQECRDRGKTIIYLSMGTVVGQEKWSVPTTDMLREVMREFAVDQNVAFVVSTGERSDPRALLRDGRERFPDHFLVARWVPQLAVLGETDVFITHGGNNGFNEALFFGVPMLVVPVFGDQHMNGTTVERLGLGATIRSPFAPNVSTDLSHVTGARIRNGLERIARNRAQIAEAIAVIQKKFLEKQEAFQANGLEELLRYAGNPCE